MEGQKEDQNMVLQDNKENRDWSELPTDIVGYIVGKLYWSDRIRICAVCKSWQQVNLECIPTIDKAAWLMTYRALEFHPSMGLIGQRKLRDTALGKVVYIDKRIAAIDGNRNLFHELQCLTSRYGWVLLGQRDSEMSRYYIYDSNMSRKYQYLLYSPFTDELIQLPELDLGYPVRCHHVRATFYLSSKNSECLVFHVHTHRDTVCINTCRPGDKTWKSYNFVQSHPIDWHRLTLSATYLGGCFYCLFSAGSLGEFNINRQEWKLLVKSWPALRRCCNEVAWPYYISGELVGIPRFPCLPYKRERVTKFDFSAKCWVEVNEMEHSDLRFSSSSKALGESSSGNHLYAYLHPRSGSFILHKKSRKKIMLIEPPLQRVWRRQHLLDRS